jgi:multicomponent Na+:H+ antiporter subunit E
MKALAWNVGLAMLWAGMSGRLSVLSLVVGLMLGSAVLFLVHGPLGIASPLTRVRHLVGLVLFFVWELLLANLRVAWDVVTPRYRMRPGVVAVPLRARTDMEITVLANLVSLTPGTLSLDVSDDRRVLYVHAMYLHDRERLVRSIQGGFERRLLKVMR